MNPRTLALTLAAALALGCKKPAPAPTPIPVPPPPPQVEAPEPAPEPVVQMVKNFQRVFFELDSARLDASSKSALDENIAIMKDNSNIKVELQGHADERGTTDYNLALGQRRAETVRRYMTNQGIPPNQLTTVSYGEEKPLRGGSNEQAWSKNRRAEFVISWGANESVRGTTN